VTDRITMSRRSAPRSARSLRALGRVLPGVVASSLLLGCGADRAQRAATASEPLQALDGASWRKLPPIPSGTEPGPGQNGTMAVVQGRPYVATITGSRRRFTGEILTLADGRWQRRVGGRRLDLGTAGTLTLAAYDGTICAGLDRRGLRVLCLRDGRWKSLGRRIWPSASRGGLGQLVAAGGVLYALRGFVDRQDRSRFSVSAYADGGWRDASPPDELLGDQDLSMQPFADGAVYCVGFQHVEGSTPPAIRVLCRRPDGGWAARGTEIPPSALGVDVESADLDSAASAGGVIFLSADVFRRDGSPSASLAQPDTGRPKPQVDWTVFTTPDATTGLSRSVRDVTEQGRLMSSGNLLWAYAFSQRLTQQGLQGWMDVRAMDPSTGQVRTVGQPLARRFRFNGPVDWELAADADSVFALFTTAVHGVPGQSTKIGVARLVLAVGPSP